MADIELVIKIPEEQKKMVDAIIELPSQVENDLISAIRHGTPLPDIEKMLSDLDLSMSYVLESDHRSFTNRETETGWLFDKIIEWRKMIQLYIKENENA